MMHLPEDSDWYLAWLVQEITVEGDPRNVVHTSTRLIHAGSAEEAYEKAIRLGEEEQTTYENSEGKQVRIVFRGLTDLNVIHEELADGAELTFQEEVGISDEEVAQMLTARADLTVFREDDEENPDIPNYIDKEVAEEFEADLGANDEDGAR